MRTTPPRRRFILAALLVLVAGPATLVSLADTPQIVNCDGYDNTK